MRRPGKGVRGQPSKAYRESLVPFSESHILTLEKACVEAYIRKQTSVIIWTSHLTKFPADFPPKVLVARKWPLHKYKVRLVALMKWLRDTTGYSDFGPYDIATMSTAFTRFEKEIDNDLCWFDEVT